MGRVDPPPRVTRGRVWGGDIAAPQKIFRIFCRKILYFDAFWRVYFLNHKLMEGVLTHLTPSSVCHCRSECNIQNIHYNYHQFLMWPE